MRTEDSTPTATSRAPARVLATPKPSFLPGALLPPLSQLYPDFLPARHRLPSLPLTPRLESTTTAAGAELAIRRSLMMRRTTLLGRIATSSVGARATRRLGSSQGPLVLSPRTTS